MDISESDDTSESDDIDESDDNDVEDCGLESASYSDLKRRIKMLEKQLDVKKNKVIEMQKANLSLQKCK